MRAILTTFMVICLYSISFAQNSKTELFRGLSDIYVLDSFYCTYYDAYYTSMEYKQRGYFLYDTDPNYPVETFFQTEENGQWTNQYHIIRTYDATSNIAEEIQELWNNNTSSWDKLGKTIYVYNTQDLPTERTNYDWNGATWVNDSKRLYQYNAAGLVLERIAQNWNGTLWENEDRYTYTYNANNDQTLELYGIWYNASWLNIDQKQISYDVNGYLVEELSSTWNDVINAWQNASKAVYTNNQVGLPIERNYSIWSTNTWMVAYRSIYTYDTNNNLLEELYQDWNAANNTWINWDRHLYTYDTNNKLVGEVEQEWSGQWQTIEDCTYHWRFFATTSVEDISNLDCSFTNPYTKGNNLTCTSLPNTFEVVVYDVLGRVQYSETVTNAQQFVINKDLPNNIYILTIQEAGKLLHSQTLLIKS